MSGCQRLCPLCGSSRSRFEDFLRDDGRLEEATAIAIKRVLAWEIQRAMQAAGVTQAEMARRMKTSRAAVRRLLDDKDPSVTLATISRAQTRYTTADGRKAVGRYTDIWARRQGRWLAVAAHVTRG